MKQEHEKLMRDDLKLLLKREPKSDEIANMETDALLLARMVMKRVELLEEEVEKLQKK